MAGELRAIGDLRVLGDVPLEVAICLPCKVVGAEGSYFTPHTAMTPALAISYLPPHHHRLSRQSVESGKCGLCNFLMRAECLEPVRHER